MKKPTPVLLVLVGVVALWVAVLTAPSSVVFWITLELAFADLWILIGELPVFLFLFSVIVLTGVVVYSGMEVVRHLKEWKSFRKTAWHTK